MIEKYGKPVDFTYIGRDIDKIINNMEFYREKAEAFFLNERIDRRCRICDNNSISEFALIYGKYHYGICDNCGSVSLMNLPDVKKMYTDRDSSNDKEYLDDTIWEKRINMITAPKIDFIIDIIKNDTSTDNIRWVDIGCGGGEALAYLNQKGISTCGVESDPEECDFLERKGLEYLKGFVDPGMTDENIEEQMKRADVLSMFNVIEHIERPKEFVHYIEGIMRPDSFLVLEFPKHPSAAMFSNLVSKDHIYRHIDTPEHLQIISFKGIKTLLGDYYDIKAKWEFGQGFMDIVNTAMVLADQKNNLMYETMLGISNEMQYTFDENGLGDQMLIVARKK